MFLCGVCVSVCFAFGVTKKTWETQTGGEEAIVVVMHAYVLAPQNKKILYHCSCTQKGGEEAILVASHADVLVPQSVVRAI